MRTEIQTRSLVYCNDIEGFVDYIKTERGIDNADDYLMKLGIDGGGDHLKGMSIEKIG